MSQKAAKTWCLRLLPVLLFFISFVTYYCSYGILQSYGGTSKSLNSSKSLCGGWLTQKKWESLNFNISRQMQLFLKLEDFFWREHLSKLALPYGIKGSELLLLKVLAVTANYQVPANIENLECRTCVVIGNGFAIKNSSLGSIINKYDVVIRLNDAPVRGYEEDVGNKTTMRFFYPESASYNPGLHNEPGTLMVLVPFKQQDLRWLKEILYNEKRVRKGFWKPPPQIWLGDVSKIRVLDPHFLHQTADRLLQIPLHPKSKQYKHNWLVHEKSEQWEGHDPTDDQHAHPTGALHHLHRLYGKGQGERTVGRRRREMVGLSTGRTEAYRQLSFFF
ncbi:CMP-N-acetylneuraminate-beta-galactosamide-alpha-2,3-sialyltransferase 4 isoform X2 [Stegastes partitus]|uniref:CMP-N-acetylneuraminate-beta-galactosamide- alpha-2,3-sialyltransferase 4 isoform X2 n=1 Tax=Stegastes partitus TaxID=144197 RepID=A0A3B4ZD21_9TELE|nr:PREDICTED: CMP-N-acetylneuraminate-beta-galactosamide-alpha-2,3-sialyltransferase 4 isoform X2 [Stegastes partitus]